MIKRILVGLSSAQFSKVGIQSAIELAQRNEAEITGITAVSLNQLRQVGPVPIGAGHLAKELREHRIEITHQSMEETIEHFNSQCKAAGVKSKVLQEERDQPFDFLISQARYHDLIILGLRGIFDYGVVQNHFSDPSLAIIKLLSGGVRPILAVPKEYREINRVFVGYSGSVESAATLRRFIQLRSPGELTMRIATFEIDKERSDNLLREAAHYCESHGVTVETQHYEESPKTHLQEAADQWNADLIVMGNSAKNILLRQVLGETALNVIRNSEKALFLSE